MAYAPAGNLTTTATITHLIAIHYKTDALDRLLPVFRFRDGCVADQMPLRKGKLCQWFRYLGYAASAGSTAATEGDVGTSLEMTSDTVDCTISQYTNFMTVSDMLKQTAIDPVIQNAARLLGELAGLVVDTIVRGIFDAAYASVTQTVQNTYLTANDFKASRHIMEGSNVKPMDDGMFFAITHPYNSYDLLADGAAGGVLDTYKYTNPEKTGNVKNSHHGQITQIGNARIVESTNVYTTTSNGDNVWDTYIIGKNAVGYVPLSGNGPTKVVDSEIEDFGVNVIPGGPENLTLANPEGRIGGAVSYNFKFGAAILDTTDYRYRIVRAPSSIVA